MIEIKIDQYAGYDEQAFLEYLKIQGRQMARILLPKRFSLYESKPTDIAFEYAAMAVVESKLNEFTDFVLEMPALNQRSFFVFELKLQRKQELAALLAWLAALYEEGNDQWATLCQEIETYFQSNKGGDARRTDYFILATQFWIMHILDRSDE